MPETIFRPEMTETQPQKKGKRRLDKMGVEVTPLEDMEEKERNKNEEWRGQE